MPTIAWPASLPKARREDHGYRPRSTALSTDFGMVSRARRIYSDAPADFTVSWLFKPDQWWYFEGFYRHALQDGTLYFRLPVIAAGVLEEREVSFNGATWQALLTGYASGRLTATLVARKGTAMDAGTWGALQAYDSVDEYAALLNAFNQFVEAEIPAPTFADEG